MTADRVNAEQPISIKIRQPQLLKGKEEEMLLTVTLQPLCTQEHDARTPRDVPLHHLESAAVLVQARTDGRCAAALPHGDTVTTSPTSRCIFLSAPTDAQLLLQVMRPTVKVIKS